MLRYADMRMLISNAENSVVPSVDKKVEVRKFFYSVNLNYYVLKTIMRDFR